MAWAHGRSDESARPVRTSLPSTRPVRFRADSRVARPSERLIGQADRFAQGARGLGFWRVRAMREELAEQTQSEELRTDHHQQYRQHEQRPGADRLILHE